jgi:hypothetical protein
VVGKPHYDDDLCGSTECASPRPRGV